MLSEFPNIVPTLRMGASSRGANEGQGGDVKSHQCTVAVCFYDESCLVPFWISSELGVD